MELVISELSEALAEAHRTINSALEVYDPVSVFALFSGGHDSLALTHVAMQHAEITSVLHINTGIGIEDTRTFVRQTCKTQNWPLTERHPPTTTYDEMVLKHGFPGPGGHLYPYVWLKERALHQLIREHAKRGRMTMLLTGVRKQESKRRMGHVDPIVKQKKRNIVWVAPLANWTAVQVGEYLQCQNLERNPVVDYLHMSGECLCGAFAHPGELDELGAWFPEVKERINSLEQQAKTAEVHCKWGTRPPKKMRTSLQKRDMRLCQDCT